MTNESYEDMLADSVRSRVDNAVQSRVAVLEEETAYLQQQLSRKDAVIEALLDKIERLEEE